MDHPSEYNIPHHHNDGIQTYKSDDFSVVLYSSLIHDHKKLEHHFRNSLKTIKLNTYYALPHQGLHGSEFKIDPKKGIVIRQGGQEYTRSIKATGVGGLMKSTIQSIDHIEQGWLINLGLVEVVLGWKELGMIFAHIINPHNNQQKLPFEGLKKGSINSVTNQARSTGLRIQQ